MAEPFAGTIELDLSSDEHSSAPNSEAPGTSQKVPVLFKSRRSSNVSECDSEKTYKCLLCNDEFEDQESLHLHIASHNSTDCHQCFECGMVFSRLASLQSHTLMHIRENKNAFSPAKDKSPPGGTTAKSNKRNKKQASSEKSVSPKSNSTEAKRKETKAKDTVTDESTQSRSTTSQTQKPNPSVNVFAMDDIHIGPLMCTFCKQTFKTQESLCTHVAANHAISNTSEKPAKKTKQKKVKDNAKKQESPEAITIFDMDEDSEDKLECPMCGLSFRDEELFQRHLDCHDDNVAQKKGPKMRCGQCRLEFMNPRALKNHIMLKHSAMTGRKSPAGLVRRRSRESDSPCSRSSISPARSTHSDIQVRAIQPCVICTEDGRKLHENSPEKSMSCMECANFFVKNLRLLIFGGKLKCDYNGKCLVAKETMESCSPCHLRVCMSTFPVLSKLSQKALAIKKLDSNCLDHVFSILSTECLHQTNCKRFMSALDDLEKDSKKKTVAPKPKSRTQSQNSSRSSSIETIIDSTAATKRPSSSTEAVCQKKLKTEPEEVDDTVMYINQDADDVICIDDDDDYDNHLDALDHSSELSSLTKDSVGVRVDEDNETPESNSARESIAMPSPVTSPASREKPKSKQKVVAKKRTGGAKKRRSSGAGSTVSSSAGSVAGGTDTESVSSSHRSRTISGEEDLPADHAESLNRSGLSHDDHLVALFTKMADWAKPIFWLWTLVPFSLQRLMEYNKKQADIAPHCSICQLFVDDPSKCEVPNDVGQGFLVSTPVMPESLFRDKPYRCNPHKKEKYPAIKEEPQSGTVLVRCTVCKVCVHAKCYGIGMNETLPDWKCAMCRAEKYDAECCLCFLRGGALQPTTDNRWCHIVCALGIPDIFFVDVEARTPINVKSITSERKKLKCRNCNFWTKEMRRHGTCAQCWEQAKCCAPLHITCGKAAGDVFRGRHDDARVPVYIRCRRHSETAKKKGFPRRTLPKVETGQLVIAKAKNGRYYTATVKSQYMEIFYEVDFSDGSVSKDLYPQDIANHDCRNLGPPPLGSDVEVLWTDKKIYQGVFKGVNNSIMYKVEFADTSIGKMRREEFYAQGEHLPDKVLEKMSDATPSKFNFDEVFATAPTVPRARCSHYPS